MTQDTTQSGADGQDTVAGGADTGLQHTQDINHLQPTMTDSASDNDSGERPVREKLKKTSIASMPRNDAGAKFSETAVEHSPTTELDERQKGDSPSNRTPSPIPELRGRLSRKRSHDDIVEADGDAGGARTRVLHNVDDVSHARKRSRDVRAVQLPATESTATPTEQTLLEGKQIHDQSPSNEAPDEELEDPAQSPRKKRSRDEFDMDAHRDQKIPATDEAKAYRRSEDSERGQLPPQDDKGAISADSSTIHQKQDTSGEKPTSSQQAGPSEPTTDLAQSTARSSSPPKAPKATEAESKSSQKPPGGFAASGFAAMSGSTKSPFGTLGASTPSIFKSNPSTISNATEIANKNTAHSEQTQAARSTFSSSASPFVTSATSSSGKSGFGFGANGAASKPSGFGGSVFGSAFVNSAAIAPKLTSFAAPTGDLAPPKPAESTRTFGAQADESAEEEDGSDGEANPEEAGNGDAAVDSRFQQQEVETGESGEQSIFLSSRAQLYYFDSGGWHEKGKGAFKLNVAEDKGERKARFIMRAHQTFRVLLNQPVFKQMQVGDSKGREPQGKNFSFAVIDQGRPTPHLLKVEIPTSYSSGSILG
ncbi:MAG: hypothetical protein Q9225_002810 [Loekoesia sp. 1 TL-2023]